MFGNKEVSKIDEEERDIDIPGEDDENVGDVPKKKREKRRKSKEERIAERKVIFWTLMVMLIITVSFWLVPVIGKIFNGEAVKIEDVKDTKEKIETETGTKKTSPKNYVEITL